MGDNIMDVNLTISLPEESFSVFRTSKDIFAKEIKEADVIKWYELGKISQSKDSEILGISRHKFLELLNNYQVSPFQVSINDLKAELNNE
jgi:predicted HTH domain antitoxin